MLQVPFPLDVQLLRLTLVVCAQLFASLQDEPKQEGGDCCRGLVIKESKNHQIIVKHCLGSL